MTVGHSKVVLGAGAIAELPERFSGNIMEVKAVIIVTPRGGILEFPDQRWRAMRLLCLMKGRVSLPFALRLTGTDSGVSMILSISWYWGEGQPLDVRAKELSWESGVCDHCWGSGRDTEAPGALSTAERPCFFPQPTCPRRWPSLR